jgi:hypothetical protein
MVDEPTRIILFQEQRRGLQDVDGWRWAFPFSHQTIAVLKHGRVRLVDTTRTQFELVAIILSIPLYCIILNSITEQHQFCHL